MPQTKVIRPMETIYIGNARLIPRLETQDQPYRMDFRHKLLRNFAPSICLNSPSSSERCHAKIRTSSRMILTKCFMENQTVSNRNLVNQEVQSRMAWFPSFRRSVCSPMFLMYQRRSISIRQRFRTPDSTF